MSFSKYATVILSLAAQVQAFGSDSGSDKIVYVIRHGEKTAPPAGSGERPEAVQCLSEKGWGRAYNMKSVFGQHPTYCGQTPCDGLPAFRTPDALFAANYADGPIDCKDELGRYRTEQTISALADSGPTSLRLPITTELGFSPQLCGAGINATFKAHLSPTVDKKLAAIAYGDGFPELSPEAASKARQWFDAIPVTDGEGNPSECVPYGTSMWKDATPEAGMCCNKASAEAILRKLMEPNINTILVAWEHINIQWLALALGAPFERVVDVGCVATGNAPDGKECWPNSNYDVVYELSYSRDGKFKGIKTELSQGFDWIGRTAGQCGQIGKA